MPEQRGRIVLSFGDFSLVIHSGSGRNKLELIYLGGELREDHSLTPRSLEVLEYLVRHHGKELDIEKDIYDAIWHGHDDGGGNVNHHISQIRKALGDDKKTTPRYIQKLDGRTVQFIAPVSSRQGSTITGPTSSAGGLLSEEKARAFEEFFGPGALNVGPTEPRGAIVVQVDTTDKIAEAVDAYARQSINSTPGNRSYKAKLWANGSDLAGGDSLITLFESHHLNLPKIVLSFPDSREDRDIPPRAPFIVAMGLGFTDRSQRAFNFCQAWLRVDSKTKAGDAVALHPKLPLRHCRLEDAEKNGFRILEDDFWMKLPRGWNDETYLPAWEEYLKENRTSHDPVDDYAIILRHTHFRGSRKQILFVLAGFTERGTLIAGRYLARDWDLLWEKYVHGKPDEGDFLALIEGPSDPNLLLDWELNEKFTVTPQDVHKAEISGCIWHDRVAERIRASEPGSVPASEQPI